MIRRAFVYSVLFISCFSTQVLAIHKIPPFSLKMTPKEVLTLAGPPKVRVEREVAREEVWEYENYKALFRDGVLVDWTGRQPEVIATPTPQAEDEEEIEEASEEVQTSNDEVPFDEILDALPKDPDGAAQPSAPPMIDPEKEMGVTD